MKFLSFMLRSVTFRCPHCGVGRLQRAPYVFNYSCGHCGYAFLPDDGDFWGGVVISYTFSGTIGIVAAGMLNAWSGLSMGNLVYATAGVTVVSVLLLFPLCKSIYTYLMYYLRGKDEEYRPPDSFDGGSGES